MHEGRGYRYTFQRARVASSPEVPKVTWWKIATFLRLPFTLANFAWTSRHFRKIALWLGIFLAMFRECLCVVARQLAPKCRDFSNVAKLARQCKWPLCRSHFNGCEVIAFSTSKLFQHSYLSEQKYTESGSLLKENNILKKKITNEHLVKDW